MQFAPILSPLDRLHAEARLVALRAAKPGSQEELEYQALRDAIAHYRCITELGSTTSGTLCLADADGDSNLTLPVQPD